MGKKVKNSTIKLKTRTVSKRKTNKVRNLSKKKKLKYKVKENKKKGEKDGDRGDLKRQVSHLCNDLQSVSLNQTQAIVKAKKLKDQKKDAKDMNTICKNMKKMLQKPESESDDEGEVAVVENLANNIKDLLIEAPHEMGFKFSKRQQESFHDHVKKQMSKDVKKQIRIKQPSHRRQKHKDRP